MNMKLTSAESAEAVRRIFASPAVRALVTEKDIRVEVAAKLETRLKDGCRGYRLEWEEVSRFEHGDFFGGNVRTAIVLKKAPVYYV